MNNVEEMLRDSLAAEADRFQPSPDLWSRINEGVGRRRRRWSWPVLLPLAAAASMAMVTGIVLLTNDEASEEVVTVPPAAPITTAPLPGTTVPVTVHCEDIHFEPNTENIASKITYSSIVLEPDKQRTGCAEATALVRKAATTHNFYSGPRTFQLDSWHCNVVTDESELAVGRYNCSLGSRLITWNKT